MSEQHDSLGKATGPQATASEMPSTGAESAEPSDGDWTDENEESCFVLGIGDCPPGEKCTVYVKEEGGCCVDAQMCVPIIGDRQLGSACTRQRYADYCAADLLCLAGASGDLGAGVCKRLCEGPLPAVCDDFGLADHQCAPYNESHLTLCEPPCHPLRPSCGSASICQLVGSGFACVLPPPDRLDTACDESCPDGSVCQPGEWLAGCETEGCCAAICDLGNPIDSCEPPLRCTPLIGNIDPTFADVGFCSAGERRAP